MDEKVDVPDEVPQVTGVPTAPVTPPKPTPDLDKAPTPDEIQRHLVKTLRDKFQKKIGAKAGTVMAYWLKNIYNTDKSMNLSIDQLNEMHQITDSKTAEEIEQLILNHDSRDKSQPATPAKTAEVKPSSNSAINNIANDISG